MTVGLVLAAGVARAQEAPLEGVVAEPIGGGSGVTLATAVVVGGDGGTSALTTRGRARLGDVTLTLAVPFATWRTADGRDAGLGNLSLGAWLPDGDHGALGVVGHLPLGRAHTWVNEVDELWPGVGLDVIYRGDQALSERVTFLGRVAGGAHTSGGFEPVPGLYAKVGVAGGLDLALHEHVGLTGEAALTWWDTSPVDLAALVRADAEGLRARAGIVLPVASWLGAQPAPVPSGVREATLRLDLAATW